MEFLWNSSFCNLKWMIGHDHVCFFHLCSDHAVVPRGVQVLIPFGKDGIDQLGTQLDSWVQVLSANYFSTLDFEILKDQKFLSVAVGQTLGTSHLIPQTELNAPLLIADCGKVYGCI